MNPTSFAPAPPHPSDFLAHLSPWFAYALAAYSIAVYVAWGIYIAGTLDRRFTSGHGLLASSLVTVPVAAAITGGAWITGAWLAGSAPAAVVVFAFALGAVYLVSSGWALDFAYFVALTARVPAVLTALDIFAPEGAPGYVMRRVRDTPGLPRTSPPVVEVPASSD